MQRLSSLIQKLKVKKNVGFWAVVVASGLAFFVLLFVLWAALNLPKLDNMQDYRPNLGSVVLSRDGRVLGEFYDSERRYPVSVESMPKWVIDAFIAAEDDGFYSHSGIDFFGILRAFWANLRAGQVVQGGSTITMQVSKALLLNSERSYGRKLREVLLAYKVEKNFTKQQILYLYLNQIYFGQRAYGVEAASRSYFRKGVKDISIAEAALLAGLVKAPSAYAPGRDTVRAKERQLYVMRRMHETNAITDEQYQKAQSEEVRVYPEENSNNLVAPYYLEHVRTTLQAKYGTEAIYNGGLVIETAADYDLSVSANKAIRANLDELDKRQGYRGALDHIATESALKELKNELRSEVLAKRFGFQLLPLKAGDKMDRAAWTDFTLSKLKASDPSLIDERKLLQPWEKYRAVVTKIEPEGKAALVSLGVIEGKIPLANMRWAKKIKGSEVSNGAQISKVNEAIKVGDIILVKPVLPLAEDVNEPVILTLEQIPLAQSALLSMEATTGYVVAMVGGYDFEHSKYNRALQGERQPGSSFKPLLYSAALDKGFTPSSIIVDSPVIFENQGGSNLKWIPENNSEKFYGDTTLRTALINSRNVPAVKLLQEVGLGYFTRYLKGIGLAGEFSADLSLALGSKTISLLELTKIYALYPRLGMRIEPVFILKVTDRDGKILEEYSFKEFQREMSSRWLEWKKQRDSERPVNNAVDGATPESTDSANSEDVQLAEANISSRSDYPPTFDDPLRAMDEKTAFQIGNLLQGVVQSGTAVGAKVLKRKVGGKTGTTNDFVDSWFMGFSPELITGVWTGFDTPRTLGKGEVGSRAALPAWIDYMATAMEKYKVDDYAVPKGIVFVRVDPKTGALAGPGNSAGVKEAFVEGTEPSLERQNQQAPESSDFFREDL